MGFSKRRKRTEEFRGALVDPTPEQKRAYDAAQLAAAPPVTAKKAKKAKAPKGKAK